MTNCKLLEKRLTSGKSSVRSFQRKSKIGFVQKERKMLSWD